MVLHKLAAGFLIYESDGHGKNVRGNKKTSTIQVRKPYGEGYLLLKSYSFPVDNPVKRHQAIHKAIEYAGLAIDRLTTLK